MVSSITSLTSLSSLSSLNPLATCPVFILNRLRFFVHSSFIPVFPFDSVPFFPRLVSSSPRLRTFLQSWHWPLCIFSSTLRSRARLSALTCDNTSANFRSFSWFLLYMLFIVVLKSDILKFIDVIELSIEEVSSIRQLTSFIVSCIFLHRHLHFFLWGLWCTSAVSHSAGIDAWLWCFPFCFRLSSVSKWVLIHLASYHQAALQSVRFFFFFHVVIFDFHFDFHLVLEDVSSTHKVLLLFCDSLSFLQFVPSHFPPCPADRTLSWLSFQSEFSRILFFYFCRRWDPCWCRPWDLCPIRCWTLCRQASALAVHAAAWADEQVSPFLLHSFFVFESEFFAALPFPKRKKVILKEIRKKPAQDF